jgi:UDP-glucose 4-epimerase
MRIMVTGGAGYIGSHVLAELIDAGHETHVIDDLSSGSRETLDRVAEITGRRAGFSRADIRDRAEVARILRGFAPQAVVHLAGLKSPAESIGQPERYHAVNAGGTSVLLEAAVVSGCRRFVFSSSAAVYGPPDCSPVDEAHGLRPITPYGASKLAAERLLEAAARREPSLSVAILRYFNPVGAHASGLIGESLASPPGNLMPQVARVAVGLSPWLEIFGDDYPTPDGTGVRDYVHVADLAAAHLAAVDWTGGGSGARVFNLGTGSGVSVRRMVEAFAAASGREIPVRVSPRRPGDVAACYADPSRAGRELGWIAANGVEAMCASAWSWAAGSVARGARPVPAAGEGERKLSLAAPNGVKPSRE